MFDRVRLGAALELVGLEIDIKLELNALEQAPRRLEDRQNSLGRKPLKTKSRIESDDSEKAVETTNYDTLIFGDVTEVLPKHLEFFGKENSVLQP